MTTTNQNNKATVLFSRVIPLILYIAVYIYTLKVFTQFSGEQQLGVDRFFIYFFLSVAFFIGLVCMLAGESSKEALFVAVIFLSFDGLIFSVNEAFHYRRVEEFQYRRAANRGDVKAQHRLGEFLYYTKEKIEEVKEWYEKAAKQGDCAAQNDLARLLKKEGRTEEAKKWYKILAGQNHPEAKYAQYTLGVIFEEEGKTKEAKKWYKKAAKQRDSDAQNNLGFILEKEGKIEEAKIWYVKAAEQEHADAQYNLGIILEKEGKLWGAIKLFQKAANKGHENAHRKFNEIEIKMLMKNKTL